MFLPGIHDNAPTVYYVQYLDSRHGWINDVHYRHVYTVRADADAHAARIVAEGWQSRVLTVKK